MKQRRWFSLRLEEAPQAKASNLNPIQIIMVLGIFFAMVAVAGPYYASFLANAADKAHAANQRVILAAVQSYISSEGMPRRGTPRGGWQEALVGRYLQEWPDPPPGYAGSYTVSGDGIYEHYSVTGVEKMPR